jgi:hypothetical protein
MAYRFNKQGKSSFHYFIVCLRTVQKIGMQKIGTTFMGADSHLCTLSFKSVYLVKVTI